MTDHDKLIRKLNDLIELDFDAIEAYEAAIERLETPAYRQKLTEFLGDHRRHTQNLSTRVTELGGEPATGPDAMRVLTEGKVVLADLVGDDHAILVAMRLNEEVTNKRYEVALAMGDIDAETRGLIEANLGDERRHRAWISDALDAGKGARSAA